MLNETQPNRYATLHGFTSAFSYLNCHGTTIWDERRGMLIDSKDEGYSLVAHEQYTDGTYHSRPFDNSSTFIHDGQLYNYLTNRVGAISSFFKLNTDKQRCERGEAGVYYEIVPQV